MQGEPPAHLCARQRAPLRARRRQGACREHEVELVLLRRDPPLECAPRGRGRRERRDGKLLGSRPRIRRLLVVADAPVSVVPCRPVMCRSFATLRRPVRGKSGSVWVLAREPPRSPSLLSLWWVSSELTMRPAAPASMVSIAIWPPEGGLRTLAKVATKSS